MKAKFTKRILAFLIDIIIVSLISSVITYFIPIKNVEEYSKQLTETVESFEKSEINQKEYVEKVEKINYQISRETVLTNLISIAIYIIYFVVIPVYNKKQSFGKRIMKIKIENIERKNITANDLLFRSFIIYGILYNIITIILILLLKEQTFIITNRYLSYMYDIMLVVILLLVIIRKDGRGLHDFVGKTIVVEEE